MGATGAAVVVTRTAGSAALRILGGIDNLIVPVTFTMSALYATGGDTLTLPTKVKGMDLKAVVICNPFDGTRWYAWDGSTTTPKIKAMTAFATEAGAVDLSANTLRVLLIFEG